MRPGLVACRAPIREKPRWTGILGGV